MPWLPETPRDVAEFLISPITFPIAFGYAVAYYTTDSDWPAPDWQANIRNYGIWTSLAGISYAYHAIVHPGKYAYVSAKGAFHVASKLVPAPVYAVAALALPMSVSYGVTAHYADKMSGHAQQPFWRSVSQALTGTGVSTGSWTP